MEPKDLKASGEMRLPQGDPYGDPLGLHESLARHREEDKLVALNGMNGALSLLGLCLISVSLPLSSLLLMAC